LLFERTFKDFGLPGGIRTGCGWASRSNASRRAIRNKMAATSGCI
jgi:hypothetical protein